MLTSFVIHNCQSDRSATVQKVKTTIESTNRVEFMYRKAQESSFPYISSEDLQTKLLNVPSILLSLR